MTRQEIATVVVKALALLVLVWAVVFSVPYLTGLIAAPFRVRTGVEWSWWELMLPLAIVVAPALLAALVFWLYAEGIGRRMVSDDPAPVTSGMSADQWLGVACAVIGIFLVADALPVFVFQIISLLRFKQYYGSDTMPPTLGWPQFVVPTVRLIVGLILILTARGLGKAIMRLRTVGLQDDEKPVG